MSCGFGADWPKEDLRALYDASVIQRDGYRRALDLIAEDGEAWLANQCDETCCEMIKLMVKYARESAGGKDS
jgi:hypothetical protein